MSSVRHILPKKYFSSSEDNEDDSTSMESKLSSNEQEECLVEEIFDLSNDSEDTEYSFETPQMYQERLKKESQRKNLKGSKTVINLTEEFFEESKTQYIEYTETNESLDSDEPEVIEVKKNDLKHLSHRTSSSIVKSRPMHSNKFGSTHKKTNSSARTRSESVYHCLTPNTTKDTMSVKQKFEELKTTIKREQAVGFKLSCNADKNKRSQGSPHYGVEYSNEEITPREIVFSLKTPSPNVTHEMTQTSNTKNKNKLTEWSQSTTTKKSSPNEMYLTSDSNKKEKLTETSQSNTARKCSSRTNLHYTSSPGMSQTSHTRKKTKLTQWSQSTTTRTPSPNEMYLTSDSNNKEKLTETSQSNTARTCSSRTNLHYTCSPGFSQTSHTKKKNDLTEWSQSITVLKSSPTEKLQYTSSPTTHELMKCVSKDMEKYEDLFLLRKHFDYKISVENINWQDNPTFINSFRKCPVPETKHCEICERLCFSKDIRGINNFAKNWFLNHTEDSATILFYNDGPEFMNMLQKDFLPHERKLRNITRKQLYDTLVMRFRGYYNKKNDIITFIVKTTHFDNWWKYVAFKTELDINVIKEWHRTSSLTFYCLGCGIPANLVKRVDKSTGDEYRVQVCANPLPKNRCMFHYDMRKTYVYVKKTPLYYRYKMK